MVGFEKYYQIKFPIHVGKLQYQVRENFQSCSIVLKTSLGQSNFRFYSPILLARATLEQNGTKPSKNLITP